MHRSGLLQRFSAESYVYGFVHGVRAFHPGNKNMPPEISETSWPLRIHAFVVQQLASRS
jgi:hypothetical protein